ncbi:MAG: tetratricopeptide repeat protein [Planctomycetes bacterium]|nr:tetratricopeptide repeat protein [Planctomycetota bacterium]
MGYNRPRPAWIAGTLLIVLATLAAYMPAMQGDFLWDDDDHVSANLAVQSPDGLGKIWSEKGSTPQYYPIVFSSFWVEYSLWGQSTVGYHVVNVALHILNALILWRVLGLLSIRYAWLAAAIFALHPVHVESVAWITERKNVLSGLFYLSALFAYLRFAAVGTATQVPRRQWVWYASACVLFIGALLSKSVTVSLPAVIMLLLWWKDRVNFRAILTVLPMFVLGAIAAATTIRLEKTQIGAVGAEWAFSPIDRVLIAGRALWFYLGKLAWPTELAFMYQRWEIEAGIWWQYLFPVAFALLLGVLWFSRNRIGKGLLVAVLIFAGTLVPALGFFDIYPMRFSFVADHFQYLASIAPITLVVVALSLVVGRMNPDHGEMGKPRRLNIRSATGALLLVTLGVLTWRQSHIYTDPVTLWRDTLSKNPDSWLAHLNLGGELEREGRLEEAIAHWETVAELGGDVYKARTNMALALVKLGDPHAAVRQLREAIRHRPQAFQPYNELAWLLSTHPDPSIRNGAEAVRLAEHAARLSNSQSPFVMGTLGAAYAEAGRFEDAIRVSQSAVKLVDEKYPPVLADIIRANIRLYEQRRPAREPPVGSGG